MMGNLGLEHRDSPLMMIFSALFHNNKPLKLYFEIVSACPTYTDMSCVVLVIYTQICLVLY